MPLASKAHRKRPVRPSWAAPQSTIVIRAAITCGLFARFANSLMCSPPLRQFFVRSRRNSSARFSCQGCAVDPFRRFPAFCRPLVVIFFFFFFFFFLLRCNMGDFGGQGVGLRPFGRRGRSGVSAGSVTPHSFIHSGRFGPWCCSLIVDQYVQTHRTRCARHRITATFWPAVNGCVQEYRYS